MKIFDGYNVIGAGESLGLSLAREDKEERLLQLLVRIRARRRHRVPYLVVFDSHWGRLAEGPRRGARGPLRVEWAMGESADDVIVRRVRKSRRPAEVEVVTSDREVLREVRALGARTLTSAEFIDRAARELGPGALPEKPRDPSPDEVEEWLRIFGEDGEEPGG